MDATLKSPFGAPQPAVSYRIQLPNGLRLTYGQILALSGDFYGDPDQPISTAPSPKDQFLANYGSLAEEQQAVTEVPQILAVLNQEFQAVANVIRQGRQPSAAYEELGDTLSFQWNSLTYHGILPRPCQNPATIVCWFPTGRYLDLAKTNWDHFGKYALICYQVGHELAMSLATQAKTQVELDIAYAVNAFADHFLTDIFSGGHIRTPRKEMYDAAYGPNSYIASILARIMHDEDSRFGLWVENQRGDSWVAYGDKRYRDVANYANAKIVQKCVQQSMDDVYEAARTRSVPRAVALDYIPNLDADWLDRRNYSPLFYWDANQQEVGRRQNVHNKLDYSFYYGLNPFSGYTYLGTWKELGFQTAGPPLSPTGPGILPPPTGPAIGLTGAPPFGTPTGATGPDVPTLPWHIIGAGGPTGP
jgi:hypothetical protein